MTALIIGGLFLGAGGAVFSVGVSSRPKYYPTAKHGFVNGMYGMGNTGTAISTFAAPVLATQIGWQAAVKWYLALLLFIVLNFLLGDRKEVKVKTPIMEQIKGIYKNEKLWLISLFYFITFGPFVAFTVYLPNFLVSNFGLDKVDAGMRTAGFIAIATFFRPIGGWLAIAFCAGLGNGIIFKLVPFYFQKQAGIANGIVSMMGGLGGFFPPIMLAAIHGITGQYSIGFMPLSQFATVSMVLVFWLYFQDKRNPDAVGGRTATQAQSKAMRK